MKKILVLYYSRTGSVKSMAIEIARGVESVAGCEALIRTVPNVRPVNQTEPVENTVAEHVYATLEDLKLCDGLALGSPTRFGNMAAAMKYFWDTTGKDWFSGTLINKPAAVFTSTNTMHCGQESTLLSMMIPLLHHGMLLLGVPASESAVLTTTTGGSFYGASHYTGVHENTTLSDDEIKICRSLGKRLAETANRYG